MRQLELALTVLGKVFGEILLAIELPRQVRSRHPSLLCPHQFHIFVLVHAYHLFLVVNFKTISSY